MAQLSFLRENCERIQAVENSFGPSGRPLSKPGRILMGEGHLMKQNRKKTELKVFFLFNDVLVYGSVILSGRWHTNQRIIPLEDIQLEDMEDSVGCQNQWLIRTPQKSFFVSAPSYKEKRDWMDHIKGCCDSLLKGDTCRPGPTFAMSWIPDRAAYRCMRCLKRFTATIRRHHCRKCGFVVCNACSTAREKIDHIHPTKKLRVCRHCHSKNGEEEMSRIRGDSTGNCLVVEDVASSSGSDEEEDDMMSYLPHGSWVNAEVEIWGKPGTY
nr:pleckstrin homology domain-containing family F member 1-like [Solea senegalensis]